MKKILLAILLIITAGADLYAQDGTEGMTMAYTSFNMSFNNKDNESVGGFYVGVFKDFELNEKVLIHPELQFAYYERDNKGRFSNISLPVLVQYEFVKSLSVIGGPQFDYLIDDDDEHFNKFSFSLALGLQYDITSLLFVNSRFSYGMTERLKNDEFAGIDSDLRTHSFNFGLGYRF